MYLNSLAKAGKVSISWPTGNEAEKIDNATTTHFLHILVNKLEVLNCEHYETVHVDIPLHHITIED